MSRDFDCVVVGAGLAGAALAVGLARCGLTVAAVDVRGPASATPLRDARGLALSVSSQRVLSALGLWVPLVPRLTPIKRIEVSARGAFGSSTLTHDDMGVLALGHICPADQLLRTLDTALGETTGLTAFLDASLTRIEVGTVRTTLKVQRAGIEQTLTARLLVAADGSHSSVRRHFGIKGRLRDYAQTAIVANVDIENPTPYTAVERFTNEGPCALLPLGGKRHVVVRCVQHAAADALLAAPPAAFLADLQQRFGWRWGRFSNAGDRRAHPLVQNRAEHLTAPRAVLVGNAANTLHPNAAQGLNLALRDVATLLDAVQDCARDGSDPGDPARLDAYAAARARDHDRTAGFSDSLARLFALDPPLRGMALAVCSALPMVRRALMARLMGVQYKPAEWLRHARGEGRP